MLIQMGGPQLQNRQQRYQPQQTTSSQQPQQKEKIVQGQFTLDTPVEDLTALYDDVTNEFANIYSEQARQRFNHDEYLPAATIAIGAKQPHTEIRVSQQRQQNGSYNVSFEVYSTDQQFGDIIGQNVYETVSDNIRQPAGGAQPQQQAPGAAGQSNQGNSGILSVEEVPHQYGIPADDYQHLTWDDIIIPEQTKEDVRDLILDPFENPDQRHFGLELPTGVALEGVPGTGKTRLAKVIASQTDAEFLQVTPNDIRNKYIGDPEEVIATLFEYARDDDQDTIIFMDEMDALFPERSELGAGATTADKGIVNQFLQDLEGLNENDNYLVIGATNNYDDLDSAITRRLSEKITFSPPTAEEREDILDLHIDRYFDEDEVDMDYLVEETAGYVGSDLRDIVNQARREAKRRYMNGEDVELIEWQDWAAALENHEPNEIYRIDEDVDTQARVGFQ